MKIFAIYDRSVDSVEPIGYLHYYERLKEYVIELKEDLDEWDAPLLFQKKVHEGEYTILNEIAYLWVKERVIPNSRQNIMEIMANAQMQEYDEMALLSITKGVCSQDECYLKEISHESLPENISRRKEKNICECFMAGDDCMVCIFRDNLVHKISLRKLSTVFQKAGYVVNNKALQQHLRIDGGGYSVSFDDNIVIPAKLLRDVSLCETIEAGDFLAYAKNGLVDTSGVCDILGCSRQNVSYLAKQGRLHPVFNDSKEKIFTMGSVWLLD